MYVLSPDIDLTKIWMVSSQSDVDEMLDRREDTLEILLDRMMTVL
jgi:hypothetical protein